MLGRPRSPETIVVGNGVAGYACARRLAELGRPVAMIGPGLPCDRPPLSKRALADGRPPYLDDAAGMAARGIRHVDALVTDYDAGRRVLRAGNAKIEARGAVVWATGLRITGPPVPGAELAGCNATPAGLERAAAELREAGRRVVVIGAGLIGTETAAALARHHRVTLLERAGSPLPRLRPPIGAAAAEALAGVGVAFLGACGVTAIERDGDGLRVDTTGHGPLRADLVLAATGVAATLPPGAAGPGAAHLDTDERLRVAGMAGTWACGDVARFPHPRFGMLTVPHWDHARATGEHVAAAIAGARTAYARDPYWFSDIGRLRIQQVGHEEAVVEWRERDGLDVGVDAAGRPACVLVLNAPARVREARALVAA
jgi:pyruvate/2-oxoglutarate dehydrogenase complex dihydrolipoamide dehydrogenase (E3) component